MKGKGLVEYVLVLVLIGIIVIAIGAMAIAITSERTVEAGWTRVEGAEAVSYKRVTIQGQRCILVARSGWESIGIACD